MCTALDRPLTMRGTEKYTLSTPNHVPLAIYTSGSLNTSSTIQEVCMYPILLPHSRNRAVSTPAHLGRHCEASGTAFLLAERCHDAEELRVCMLSRRLRVQPRILIVTPTTHANCRTCQSRERTFLVEAYSTLMQKPCLHFVMPSPFPGAGSLLQLEAG